MKVPAKTKSYVTTAALSKKFGLIVAAHLLLFLLACTTTTVDEYRTNPSRLVLKAEEQIVVLGRRHAGDYETEPELIECIRKKLTKNPNMTVVPEQAFVDALYPWFEPRTAPLGLNKLSKMLSDPLIGQHLRQQDVRYMIWVDGSTATTDKEGSVSCAVGPGGGGCFGFATWEKTASYESIIWDIHELSERGRVKVDAKGSSYLIAIGAPIPIIAQVQDEACEGIGKQLSSFFL